MIWNNYPLEEFFKISSSKRVLKSQWKKSGIPFYRGREITTLSKFGNVKNDLFISHEHYSELVKKNGVPTAGDILITAIGTIGNSYIVKKGDRFYFKDASVLWLHKIKDIDSRFVDYWFKSDSFKKQLDSGNGATVDSLSISKLKSIKISIPPIDEQKIIVARLNKAFEKIQNIKNQTNKKKELIIELKNSIISKYTRKDNESPGLPWGSAPLSNLCKKSKNDIVDGPFGSNLKTKDYTDEGIPVLKIQHVKQFEINYSKPTFISHKKYEDLIRHSFKKGDIVITKLGDPLGAASIVKNIDEGIIVADLVRVRTDPQKIDNEFLCYQLNSSHIQAEINSFTRGATRPRIKLDVIRTLRINFPSLEEQKNICKKLNKILQEILKYIKINDEINKQIELLELSSLRIFDKK